jgi:hypothetical protein
MSALAPSPASAQDDRRTVASARVGSYADTDSTLVLRPRVSARGAIDDVVLAGAYTADVISSASIDVVTRASRPIEEARHQLDAQASWLGERGLVLGGGYSFGIEPDFDTHALTLRGAYDLDPERMWHGVVSITALTNRYGSVIDPSFDERTYTLQVAVALARVLDARGVARGAIEASVVSGFQASPYRNVRLGNWTAQRYTGSDPSAGAYLFSGVTGVAREQHPDRRLRMRAVIDVVREVERNFALFGSTAGYVDDWGIGAFEVALEARWEPERDLLFRLGGRMYLQTAAWFWRRRYFTIDETQGILTDDKELGPLHSFSFWLAGSIPIDPTVRLDGRLDLTRYEYPGFSLRTAKLAMALEIGVVWTP